MSIATILRKNCNQTAVYWAAPVKDGYGGFTYGDPVEISVRWQDKTEIIMDSKGVEMISKAEVFTIQDVAEQGILYLGDLDDLDSTQEDDPATITGAHSIKRFEKSPTANGREFVRKVWL